MALSGKISIIILMHNEIPLTQKCLVHLARAVENFDHEVIVLDNASTEDTTPVRDCSDLFQQLRFIRNNENSTFSAGNNLGAASASGDWLLFLNNDVFVKPDAVKRLLGGASAESDIGVTGGKLLFSDEKTVQHAGICQMLWEHPSNYGVGAHPFDRRISQGCERFALSGAMLCLPRKAFEKVGGFDTRYVWGTEDIDLCLKIRSARLPVVYCPDAAAVHIESATLRRNPAPHREGNCKLFRQLWNHVLIPSEQAYIARLKEQGIRRMVVFGMGSASRSMSEILIQNGIRIVAYTASCVTSPEESFLGTPVLPLEMVSRESYDRLIVASQYFFAVESVIRQYDPLGEPIYPVLI